MSKIIEQQGKLQIKTGAKVARQTSANLRQEVREKERAEKEKQRITEKAAKETARAQTKSAKDAAQAEIKAIRDAARERKKADQEAKRARDKYARAVGKNVDRAGGAIGRVAGGAGRLLGAGLALAGGVSVAGSIGQRLGNQTMAGGYANAVLASGGSSKSYAQLQGEVMGRAKGLQEKYGLQDQGTVMAMEQEFFGNTGSYDAAASIAPQLVDLGKAVGASEDTFVEMASVASNVFANLKNSGRTYDQALTETATIVRASVGQGLKGSMAADEVAQAAPKLMGVAGSLGGDVTKNFAEVLALANVAKLTTGSAETATTGVENVAADLGRNSKKLQAMGVKTKDATGNTRGLQDLIVESAMKSKGSQDKMRTVFGEQAVRVVQPFFKMVREMTAAGASKDEIEKALRAPLEELNAATLDEAKVKELAANSQADQATRMQAAISRLQNSLGEKLAPEIDRLIPILEKAVPALVSFLEKMVHVVDWFAKNPFEGMTALISGAIIKELAAAKIGSLISSALSGGGSGAIGGAGGAGKLATGLGVVAAAGAGWALGSAGAEMLDASWDANQSQAEGGITAAWGAMRGGTSLADKQKALAALDQNIAEQKDNRSSFSGLAGRLFGAVTGVKGADEQALEESERTRLELQAQIIEAQKKLADETVAAAERMKQANPETNATKVGKPPGSGSF